MASIPGSPVPLALLFDMGGFTVAVCLGALGGLAAYFLRPYLLRTRQMRQATPAELSAVAASPAPAGQATLYVFRYPMPGDKAYDIELDGKSVAKLKGNMYVQLAIQPGEHRLTAGPKGLAGMAQKPSTLPFSAGADETIVISAHPGNGGMAQNQVQVTLEQDRSTAMNSIATMERVEPSL